MIRRSYSELRSLESFEDRYDYLALKGFVGEATFGHERVLNQRFYKSREWRDLRHYVITRDNGLDLGHPDHPIFERPIIHHMTPMVRDDIIHGNRDILDPEFLITTTHRTHNAIHYGDKSQLSLGRKPRHVGDTKLW